MTIAEPAGGLDYYRTLLSELKRANTDMEEGRYRIFKQETGSPEMLDVTPEAIRTNQVSIVLLQGAITLKELGGA